MPSKKKLLLVGTLIIVGAIVFIVEAKIGIGLISK